MFKRRCHKDSRIWKLRLEISEARRLKTDHNWLYRWDLSHESSEIGLPNQCVWIEKNGKDLGPGIILLCVYDTCYVSHFV